LDDIEREIDRQMARLLPRTTDRVQRKILEALRRNECRGNLISKPQQRGSNLTQAVARLEIKRLDPWLYKIQNKLASARQRLNRKQHGKNCEYRQQGNFASESNGLGGDANSAEQS
jgi:hypothetical protein